MAGMDTNGIQPGVEPSPSAVPASKARLIAGYTFSLSGLQIVAGMVWEIIRRSLPGTPAAQVWGQIDAASVTKLIVSAIVCVAVYRHLSRRHRKDFLSLGIPIAVLAAVLDFLMGALIAPAGTPFLSGWVVATVLTFELSVMFLSGWIFGAIGTPWASPNKSLERTREG